MCPRCHYEQAECQQFPGNRLYEEIPMKSTATIDPTQQTPEFVIPVATIDEPPTLLVVDDDATFRGLEVELLASQGYKVLQAEGAAEALRLASSTTAIHLLVTDFCMPDTNGLELALRFRDVHPKAPVLMVSGSLREIPLTAKDLDRFAILGKPFTFDELLGKVHALLTEVAPLPVRTD
jgi:DNA-binding response OmpR family regulator